MAYKVDFWNYKGHYKEISISDYANDIIMDEVQEAIDQGKDSCNNSSPHPRWGCTRPEGHKGPHIGCGGDVCGIWHENSGIYPVE